MYTPREREIDTSIYIYIYMFGCCYEGLRSGYQRGAPY